MGGALDHSIHPPPLPPKPTAHLILYQTFYRLQVHHKVFFIIKTQPSRATPKHSPCCAVSSTFITPISYTCSVSLFQSILYSSAGYSICPVSLNSIFPPELFVSLIKTTFAVFWCTMYCCYWAVSLCSILSVTWSSPEHYVFYKRFLQYSTQILLQS